LGHQGDARQWWAGDGGVDAGQRHVRVRCSHLAGSMGLVHAS
jgi:hypothetical protein